MSESLYRKHEYVANSDIKGLMSQLSAYEEPENLDRIFEFGTLVHALILEPHKADYTDPDIHLALKMRDTFLADEFCRSFVKHPMFRAEHNFYRHNLLGINAKCRMDGELRPGKKILEFKSLAVTSQKAFEEAVYHFSYDQGAAWYLDVSRYDALLIAGVSKKKPDKLFKLVVTRDSDVYKSGLEKYTYWVNKWKELVN